MNYNKNTGYGMLRAMAIANNLPTMGRFFVVVPVGDKNFDVMSTIFNNDPEGNVRFFSTLSAAYTAAITNNNDVIFLAGDTSHVLTAGLAWSKNRIHVVGLDGGFRLTDQGAKIEVTSSTDATGYVLNVTGTRNSFRNVKFIQSSVNASALNVLTMGGEGNLYMNCSAIFSVANNLGSTSASEVICGEDSGTFINCEFGADTLLTSAARAVFLAKTQTTEMKSNRFQNCTFKISSSSATATFFRLNAITDILFTNLFDDCKFMASVDTAGGIALTAGAIQTGTGTIKGTINLAYPSVFNCGVSLASSGYNAAVQVVAPTSAATAIKGIQPTA